MRDHIQAFNRTSSEQTRCENNTGYRPYRTNSVWGETLGVPLLPCFCLLFNYAGHVLRIHKFFDTRNLLSVEAKSEHIFIVVWLSGYGLAISEKLKSSLTNTENQRRKGSWHEARRRLVLGLHLSPQAKNSIEYPPDWVDGTWTLFSTHVKFLDR